MDTEKAAEVMSRVDNLTPEHMEKWEAFIDILNEGVEHVFGEQGAAIVLGLQFDGMGQDESLPVCIGTSNLPPCAARGAVDDLVDFIDAQHTQAHEAADNTPFVIGEGGPRAIGVPMDPANVPEELREQIEKFAEQFGLDASNVQFVEVADTGDLADLPETEEPNRDETPEG